MSGGRKPRHLGGIFIKGPWDGSRSGVNDKETWPGRTQDINLWILDRKGTRLRCGRPLWKAFLWSRRCQGIGRKYNGKSLGRKIVLIIKSGISAGTFSNSNFGNPEVVRTAFWLKLVRVVWESTKTRVRIIIIWCYLNRNWVESHSEFRLGDY